jgi:hypothetical protein
VREVKYANYTLRALTLRRGAQTRQLTQFQYTEWACYGAPLKANIQL